MFFRQISYKSAGGWVHVMRWEGFRESSLVEIVQLRNEDKFVDNNDHMTV